MDNNKSLILERKEYSRTRLEQLKIKVGEIGELNLFPEISIYCAGSFARLEASEYSDIDLFFLYSSPLEDLDEPRTKQIQFFSKIIGVVDKMGFPKLSNDGEYLTLMHTNQLVDHLGSRIDDYNNYFTARMLLLLESKCIYQQIIYKSTIEKVIDSYFRDFPDHEDSFKPTFLVNDIIRYWKTLCLNYENKRNHFTEDPEKKIKHKIRNFKLKFSRMNTCFAMIAGFLCQKEPIDQKAIYKLTCMTPMERLEMTATLVTACEDILIDLQDQYSWFLNLTGLPTEDLQNAFRDKEFVRDAFDKSRKYGDSMFELMQLIDRNHYLRYLVI